MTDWRGTAFGLELRGDFDAPGLPTATLPTGAATELRLVPALGGSHAVELLAEQPLPGGRFAVARDQHGAFLVRHSFYGDFRVADGGGRIDCSPADLPGWVWQRFLVAQLLPLAALLHGCEPIHAGVASVGGRALLVVGASGAGKSSLALHLAARGGGFLADDVAALAFRGEEVVVHPGPPLASVDLAEVKRLPPGAADRWRRLGVLDGEARLALPDPGREPSAVAAVYLLRWAGEGTTPVIGAYPGSPSVLLGATFNAYIRGRDRLVRLLDVAGRLAGSATLREVVVPHGADAAAVAEAILADL